MTRLCAPLCAFYCLHASDAGATQDMLLRATAPEESFAAFTDGDNVERSAPCQRARVKEGEDSGAGETGNSRRHLKLLSPASLRTVAAIAGDAVPLCRDTVSLRVSLLEKRCMK